MENKSNSLNRIKRQQREKVLRFSIRKYSFGAASVAVAALMFLGARVASADSLVDKTSYSTAGVVTPESKVDSPEDVTKSTANKVDEGHKSPENQVPAVPANSAPTVDKAKLKKVVEELNVLLSTKLNLDESVVSSVKDRLQKGKEALESSELAQKDIDELAELLSKDVTVVSAAKEVTEVQVDKQADKTEKPADNLASQTSPEVSASEESQTVSAKKDALKVSVDQLQAAVLELPEHETSKEVLEKANELLGLAQGVLENTTVSLNDVEDMTKRVKRMFNSVKNATTRLTSGARDSRNGKSMGEGTGGRAATVSPTWTNQNNLLIYQRFRATDGDGNIRNDNRQFTENKVDMTARTQMIDGQKYLVYDVFFNNDGQKMVHLSRQQLYNVILPPKILDLQSNGAYKSDTIRDLYFETYRRKNQNEGGTLSQNPDKFRYESTQDFHFLNDTSKSKGSLTFLNTLGVRDGRSHDSDMRDYFKNNYNRYKDQFLNDATRLDGVNRSWSYGIGVRTNDVTAAIHMHFKAKLRPGVTDEEIQKAFTLAITGTYGSTTNHSYVFGSGKKDGENVEPTVKQSTKYPIIGKEVTKKVDEPLGNLNNPVESGFVTRNDGSKNFPNNMSWSWPNGQPNTGTAGVFQRQVKATYNDNSSNTTTATLKVIPNQPTIDQRSVNEKAGKTGQKVTVNVGNGVPNNSKVNLYEGKTLIGTGITNGGTATVTVTGALPEKPITAETVVNNGGTVTSERSNPVTPTPERDTQKPTLEILPKTPTTVVEGDTVTFTVTAKDDKSVTIDPDDFLKKYGDRLLSRQATNKNVKITKTEKVIEITITTKKEDVGGPHEITFGAHDDAGNKADPVKFTFNVTPRDNQKPIVEVGGVRLTENEPQSAQFYVYRGATFNPTVKAWDNSGNITSMSVENLPNGSKAQTYTPQTGKDGSTEDKKYTTSLSTGTVADTQTLGDHVAKFKISDGVNSATYLMKYKVVDVVVENTPKTVELNSKSGDPNEYLNTAGKQDKSGKPVVESQADVHFPGGMKFRWDNANGSDTNITLSKVGTQTHKAIAVFPKNPSKRGSVQVFAPEKAERNVVFNVVDNEKPKATLNGKELSETANEPIFTVYRGATFNPELKVSDNSGVISKVEVKGGLPKGVNPSTFTAQTGKTEATPYAERLSSGTVLNTETLGVHESTIHVEGSSPSDSRDFKFKYRVVDIETKNVDEHGIAKVPVASTLNKANSSKNIDAHNYLKVVDSQDKADRGNNYLPSGMTWTWKDRDGVNQDRGTTLDNSGKYTRTATAIFPGTKANNMTDATSTTRDVFAPAEIKRKVILAVTPTAPIVEGKENGSVTITPPTRPDSTNKQDIDTITLTYVPTGKTSPETVTVTKSGNNWTVNGKTPDKVSVSPEGVVTISDAEVADKTEVTAKVSKNIDNVVLESPVARGTANGPLAAEVTPPAPVTEKAPITPVTVVTPNKPGSSITVDGPVNGLTVDDEGKLKGKPEVNDWKPKEEERTVEIPVKVTHGGETVTVKVPVPILRDTDGDGIPDKVDSDDDNDGIPDEEEIKNGTNPKVADNLTGTVTEKTVPEKKPVPANTKVITPNKPGTTITTDKPVNGLTVDNGGNLKGTPEVDNWEPKEEERTVEIPVKLKKGTEEVVVKVPVKVQRDTDGDGIPDKEDSDDDNDGIPDEEEIKNGTNPKVADNLTGTVTEKTVPEKKPVPANTKVITPNKPGTTITTDKPVNGLTVDNGGNLKGTPEVDNWEPKEEERTVEIPVKLKKGTEEVVVKVPVKVQRDTDGDGIPDKEDSDDDNDGIPDEEEIKNGTNPKVADNLTGTVTEKTVPEKKPVPANTKVITPNKPGTTITTDKPVNGLTVDNGGNLKGTPEVDNWEPKEEERTVEIPVKLKKGTEEVVVKVPVKIQRDTDGDGIPDVKDPDDDNDGIPDTEDARPKVADNLTGTVTEKTVPEKKPVPANTKVITPNKPGTTITTDKPVNGLTVDNGGNLKGTPEVDNWEPKEEERTVEIPVKLKKGTEEVVVKVPVKIQRDTDGDGIPDVKDPDDDNDGIPDEEEIKNGTDPKTPTTQTPTIEITQQPNGDAIVTPKKPDGSTYPPGTKVEIPGENGTTITVTIGDNGSGEVPNDKLPKKAVPGTGTVTEPKKNPSKPVDVTTPAHKKPKLELEQDPKTGDVTVTPKKPDGSTFPPKTKVEIPGKDKDHPITVTIGEDGKGKVPNSELPDGKVPGTGKITEPGKPTEEVPVETPSKIIPGAPTTEQPVAIEINQKPNGDAVVTPKKEDGNPYPSGTKVEIPGEDKDGNPITITVTIGENGSGEVPNDKLPKKDIPGKGKVTEPKKNPSQPVPVTTPAHKKPKLELEQDPKTGDVTVTPKKPDGSTFPPKTKVEIPGKDKDHPITVTIGEDGKGKVPNSELPDGKVPGTGKITEPGKPTEEVPVTTPAHKTPKLELEQDPKTGDVTVTPKKPDGSTFPPKTKVEIPGKDKDHPITVTIGEDGKGKVPNSELPEGKVPGKGKITEPGRPTEEVPVETPAHKTPTLDVEQDPKTGDVTVTPKRPDGSPFPPGTKVEIPGKDKDHPITVTIGEDGKGKVPNSELPEGKVPGTGKITEPGRPTEEVPNVTTPAHKTPTLDVERDPKTGDVTVTPKRPGGGTYPPGTKVEIPGENGPITVEIGQNGKGKVPNDNLPKKDVPGTGKITEPGKPTVEVPNVTTPGKFTPETPVTEKPGEIGITQQPNGNAIVTPKKPDGSTYPPRTKVEIPGENGTTITVTIGDNGSGEVPNDKLPKGNVPGKGTVTEPNKKPSQPVDVTTPARKTPTVELEQDPKTGDVTVTPKKPDGSTYPPGTTVEIPGKDKDHPITVTTDDNGKAKVPNADLPEGKVPGTGKITEPGKPTEEVPNVTTPGKFTPETPVTEKPGKIEITQQPNGNAIVTPKKPDGSTYPPRTKVEIPGENGTTITVTIGDNGSGEVPNDKLPKGNVPGKGTVTEPNKKPSQPVDVTTPARKTPTVELEQDPKTGDVIVTPKKPDGTPYESGTKVEIPGKDKDHPITVTIGEDGKGKVPNSELPDGKVPGTAKITEPGRPTEEVPVETPARKTPTLDVERDPKTGDVTVTPKKPDGSIYPPGTKVEIPGENGPITVEIGQNGKGKVPNDNLPKKDVPGTAKITEPGKPTEEVPNVTTPGKFTPETPVTEKPGKIEITQQPNGNAIVTPKKPDGTTYPSGSKVEIPGEDGTTITVTIGDNGSGEVPNDKLPKKDVPGTGTVTEPNKKPSQPVDVTTPARKTPTVELEQDPKTGDVTVTPKKPDGSTYPPGTKVEIPGKDGNSIIVTIGEDGKGKVPNSELPEGKVPGTAKITEPGQPTVEVPDVTTPGKVTPSTDTNPVAPVTPDMPVKPDTNGDSGQDKPAPATPTPNAVAPNADQVDAKTTVDNGAKSNDSQNVLPNTGTESNATLASLGLLGLLSGFGLVARKKKED